MTGTLVAIYTTPDGGGPMEGHDEVAAVAGSGLAGDRYAAAAGTFSGNAGEGREVTLIAREGIDAANDEGLPSNRTGAPQSRDRRHRSRRAHRPDVRGGRRRPARRARLPAVQVPRADGAPRCVAALEVAVACADIVRAGVIRVGDKIVEVDAV